jgi:hypothetical protein
MSARDRVAVLSVLECGGEGGDLKALTALGRDGLRAVSGERRGGTGCHACVVLNRVTNSVSRAALAARSPEDIAIC